MDSIFPIYFFQTVNIALILGWIIMSVIALKKLGGDKMHATPKAIWALIIVCIPVLGSIAFFIVKPGNVAE